MRVLTGCSVLGPKNAVAPAFYSLDAAGASTAAALPPPASAPTLLVAPTRAAAGFDSPRIIYTREPHAIAYFAHSEWVDTPARMLGALLVSAMERNGAFRAVSITSGAAAGDLRLDTELVRLQHEFQLQPSRVRFTLRATLVEDRTRRVLGWREIDSVVESASQDPYGGVVAANAAVQRALQELSAFCIETLRQRPSTP
ncbi:MAG: ABC-type transport auxiliary lipoprotein family protein [Rhodoferax sp.]|nr:ABC-type transport auxiliary lipoprotein family protein [Rhodoferax sp.]